MLWEVLEFWTKIFFRPRPLVLFIFHSTKQILISWVVQFFCRLHHFLASSNNEPTIFFSMFPFSIRPSDGYLRKRQSNCINHQSVFLLIPSELVAILLSSVSNSLYIIIIIIDFIFITPRVNWITLFVYLCCSPKWILDRPRLFAHCKHLANGLLGCTHLKNFYGILCKRHSSLFPDELFYAAPNYFFERIAAYTPHICTDKIDSVRIIFP